MTHVTMHSPVCTFITFRFVADVQCLFYVFTLLSIFWYIPCIYEFMHEFPSVLNVSPHLTSAL